MNWYRRITTPFTDELLAKEIRVVGESLDEQAKAEAFQMDAYLAGLEDLAELGRVFQDRQDRRQRLGLGKTVEPGLLRRKQAWEALEKLVAEGAGPAMRTWAGSGEVVEEPRLTYDEAMVKARLTEDIRAGRPVLGLPPAMADQARRRPTSTEAAELLALVADD